MIPRNHQEVEPGPRGIIHSISSERHVLTSSSERGVAVGPPATTPSSTTNASGSKHHHSSGRRERHKTMLVRQTASYLSKSAEDSKPAEQVKPPFDHKRAKMMSAVMMWSKNLSRSKVIVISHAFNKWKYLGMTSMSVSQEGNNKKEKIGEQKNGYLLLFKENERLREQLNESRKSALLNEKSLRNRAVVSMLRIVKRSRMTARQRYYYDIWLNNTRKMQQMSITQQRSMELEVGLQRIDSERHYVQKIERLNTQLKLTLAMTVSFFKWKGRAALLTLHEERSMYEKQRTLIFNELIRIRRVVSLANKQEVAAMNNALSRGDELAGAMESLREQLSKAVRLGKSTTAGLNLHGSGGVEEGGHNNSDTTSVVTSTTGGGSSRRTKARDHSAVPTN